MKKATQSAKEAPESWSVRNLARKGKTYLFDRMALVSPGKSEKNPPPGCQDSTCEAGVQLEFQATTEKQGFAQADIYPARIPFPGKTGQRQSANTRPFRTIYFPVWLKLVAAISISTLWVAVCFQIARPWIHDLAAIFSMPLALTIIFGIALIPGWANAFLVFGLLIDRRPVYRSHELLPAVSVLIAAFNEEQTIYTTIESVIKQKYPGQVEIMVLDDGSTDNTVDEVERAAHDFADVEGIYLHLVRQPKNSGKAAALNVGLQKATHDIIVTIDADTHMFRESLARLVTCLIDGPADTAAVAGTVLVQNSRTNLITRLQEWDYFLGIAVVKRIQSLYQGTLVAQGAFSAYRKDAVQKLGGWAQTVGEDIVLTWGLHKLSYKVSYAENAFVFTKVPESYLQLFRQRKRWARGMIEAFKYHYPLLFRPRLITPFIYLNVLFPYLDAAFLFAFIPGLIAAVFLQNYAIVGFMTLFLLPLMLLVNIIMFLHQRSIFRRHGLRVRRNIIGLLFYMLLYQLVISPASLAGYLAEFVNLRKSWGTK